MGGNRTFTMIKPDAMGNAYAGKIIDHILSNGFTLKAMKLAHLTKDQAAEFYAVHKARPFYSGLVDFMSSGPIIAAVLEGNNAVESFRTIIGSTNPEEADEGTIRKLYAEDIGRNAVHGSDSDENAGIEASFFFSAFEKV